MVLSTDYRCSVLRGIFQTYPKCFANLGRLAEKIDLSAVFSTKILNCHTVISIRVWNVSFGRKEFMI